MALIVVVGPVHMLPTHARDWTTFVRNPVVSLSEGQYGVMDENGHDATDGIVFTSLGNAQRWISTMKKKISQE